MQLIFDTETSGLLKPDLPASDPAQPALVQLGAALFDAKGACTGRISCLISPDGWGIEPDAERVHGITEARCARHGVPLVAALAVLKGFVLNASRIVAHHMEFDAKVIAAALHRAGSEGLWWAKTAPTRVCTMEASKPVLQLPGQFGDFKYPSLEEAHNVLVPGAPFVSRHDADADLDATRRVFLALEAQDAVPKRSISQIGTIRL